MCSVTMLGYGPQYCQNYHLLQKSQKYVFMLNLRLLELGNKLIFWLFFFRGERKGRWRERENLSQMWGWISRP